MNYAIDGTCTQNIADQMGGQESDADTKVKRILTLYGTCAGHATKGHGLGSAFTTYESTHRKTHQSFPAEITRLAKNTKQGAKTMVDGENVTQGLFRKVATTNEELVTDVNTTPREHNPLPSERDEKKQ